MVEAVSASGELVETSSILQVLRKLRRPRAIVIVPTRHLVSQITKTAKDLAHHCKLRVLGIHGRSKNVADSLMTPVDIT